MKKNKKFYFSFAIFLPTLITIVFISSLNINIFSNYIQFENFPLKQAIINALYWIIVAALITVLIRYNTIRLYEAPMKTIAEATNRVAHGDFTVYVKTIHTPEKYDYLDYMILDFNKMVEELGSVETLKTDFFSNVSHEIKTPLSIVQNYAELLMHEKITEKQRKEYAEGICNSTKKLSNLITNILKINRLEKQKIDCNYERYDICEQICESILSFEELWDKKKIDIIVDIEDQRYVFLDKELMELVWNNLLSNAIKFTEENGSITIHQYIKDQKCIVEVSDTGCGMSKKTMKHIFDKFYQGDTSHATQGNGLGLALVSKIMNLLNSKISVDSTLGKGTVFIVELPLHAKQIEGEI